LPSFISGAQSCKISLSGRISDPHDDLGLQFGQVYIEETGAYRKTDSAGFFRFENMCPGWYHLYISHPGCVSSRLYFQLGNRDTVLSILLEHHAHLLQTVDVQGVRTGHQSSTQNSLRIQELTNLTAKPLGLLLEEFNGVNSIKNGGNISKPVIHGMSGNRIGILTQGVQLASQQWGADHAPEIDPFGSQIITVIKGADAVAYGGNHLGGIVLLDQEKINHDPHLHGSHVHGVQSNGNVLSWNSRIEKSSRLFDWRTSFSSKIGGDLRSPSYYLSNTGIREYSGNLYLYRAKGSSLVLKNFFSLYHAQLGVLRGSHIGNLTDLEDAIGRAVPFFTKPDFSYRIESPSQVVSHIFNKFTRQKQTETSFSEFNISAQLNRRQEFDVRRVRFQDAPALDLLLQSWLLEYKYKKTEKKLEWQAGTQHKVNYNYNVPGSSSFPLIPDYFLFNPGLFGQLKLRSGSWTYEAGTRYEVNYFSANLISRNALEPSQTKNHLFHVFNSVFGAMVSPAKGWSMKIQTGVAGRSPEMNELYSNGLHQSVAGIEEGNKNLNPEYSFKTLFTHSLNPTESWTFELTPYFQYIRDYIYLEPQNTYRLTIRGAFPVFSYRQTDVWVYGLDLTHRLELGHDWQWISRLSYVNIMRRDDGSTLVGTPAPQIFNSISYHLPAFKKNTHSKISINGRYVFERTNVADSTDFLDPPPAYFLMGAEFQSDFKFFHKRFQFILRGENLFNRTYREYLNRLRYFADETGTNLGVVLKMEM